MSRYLNKFASIVPKIQGKQILELLNSAKDSGEIRTLEEYQQRLQELTDVLRNTDPQPTYKIFQAIVGKPIRSDAFNTMITSMINDLETSFKEINNIAEVLQIHKTLINENILNNLKFAISDLENKIVIQEFLNSDNNGFTTAQFNTFKQGDSLATQRSNPIASNVFIDNQTAGPVGSQYDAVTDLIGEKLIMAPKRTKSIPIRDVRILVDAETRLSEIDVTFPGSNIRNLIDGLTGTYWIYPVLLGTPDRSGIVVKLEVILPGYQDVNFIEIEPATLAGFTLEQIIYTDVNIENQTLPIDPIFINKKTRLDFDVITTKKFVLIFRQETYQSVQYSYNQNANTWERVIANDPITLDDIDKTVVNDELLKVLNSEELRSLNDITEETEYLNVNMVEYLVGFDNLRIGFTRYHNTSIFVSSVLEAYKAGILGLQVQQNRLVNADDIPTSSFEYNIYKQNFASDGSLIDSEQLPILPDNINAIIHERLVFNRTSAITNDTATLRFYPDTSQPIYIYKDFNLLEEGTGTETGPITPTTADYIVVDNTESTPPEFKVRLDEPSVTSVYTVSYIPKYSGSTAGTEVWLNKQRTMKIKRGNIIEFTNSRPNTTVDYSRLYLTILMRNNSSDDTRTASLEQYNLLVGTIDTQRFIA